MFGRDAVVFIFFYLFLCVAPKCSASLGMENSLIKNAQIAASSQWDSNHAASQARLNFKAGGGKAGSWSARWNDHSQWIQVTLGSYTKLTGIATQGRNGWSQWVTKYQLQYSDDGVNFYSYKVPGQRWSKVIPYSSEKVHTLNAFLTSLPYRFTT